MRLLINGEEKDHISAETVGELLSELNVRTGRVAVEVNMYVVKKTEYDSFRLKENDSVEIVNFVGGG